MSQASLKGSAGGTYSTASGNQKLDARQKCNATGHIDPAKQDADNLKALQKTSKHDLTHFSKRSEA